jgi:hypothetical protein
VKTDIASTQLPKIAAVAIQPETLLRLPGKQQINILANKGSNTAAMAKYMADRSWYGKGAFKFYLYSNN